MSHVHCGQFAGNFNLTEYSMRYDILSLWSKYFVILLSKYCRHCKKVIFTEMMKTYCLHDDLHLVVRKMKLSGAMDVGWQFILPFHVKTYFATLQFKTLCDPSLFLLQTRAYNSPDFQPVHALLSTPLTCCHLNHW